MYEELNPSQRYFATTQAEAVDSTENGAPPADILRQELENELNASKEDITSYPWYHGKLPRDVAEDLMVKEGDFLVRESVTNVGDYVLTCKDKGAYYHFKIDKIVNKISQSDTTLRYCLEERQFESLPALVLCYASEKLPVSKKTGVVLGQPVNRVMPISYSDVKYASLRRNPKGKYLLGSAGNWNDNAKAQTGARQTSTPNLLTFPLSSSSSMKIHDSPRTPSSLNVNALYATPRSPASPISLHQRKTSDPLPSLPGKGAVVVEEHIATNSYPVLGGQGSASSYQTTAESRKNNILLELSPGWANETNPQPFPLALLSDGNGHPSGAEDKLTRFAKDLHRPASQADTNIENHGMNVSRTSSDPLLSLPSKIKCGSKPPSPHLHSMNNSNSASPYHSPSVSEVTKSRSVPPKPSRVPSIRTPIIKGTKSLGTGQITSLTGSLKNSVALLGDKQVTPPTISEVSKSLDSSVSMRSKPPRSRKVQGLGQQKGKRASCFKPAQYRCAILSPENPPLEQRALAEVKTLLSTTDPFKLARHMTVIDCKVCRVMEGDLGRIVLPHASQLRQDIIERYQCIAFWVAICVIKCSDGKEERAEMLNIFIQVANELVHSMGNVLGFSAIMHGITSPQVSSLDSSWDLVRLNFTNNAVTFEKKLRPLLHLLDEGKGQIRNGATCIPHIMPLVRLLEHTGSGIPHTSIQESITKESGSFGSLLDRFPPTNSLKEDTASLSSSGRDTSKVDWWENMPDESFDSLLSHLHSGRSVLSNLEEFKKNANSKLVDFKEISKIREIFTTDFQIRLLFGYKSAESPRNDRFHKFDRIISAMRRLIEE